VRALENFRENLREALEYLDVTQESLAEHSDLSRPYINRILAGKQEPSLPTCDQICDAIKIPLAKMLDENAVFRRFLKKMERPVAAT